MKGHRLRIQQLKSIIHRSVIRAKYLLLGSSMIGFILCTQVMGLDAGMRHMAQAKPSEASSIPKTHTLPTELQNWIPASETQNYFDQIQKLPLGYLLWSNFPVQIFVGPSHFSDESRSTAWTNDVRDAIAEWQPFFPIEITALQEEADISIEQVRPKRTSQGRIRSAQATPKVYCEGDRLQHRFKIEISPSQTGQYIKAATRHELGHALGLWGHSKNAEDVLYFSQISNPPEISARDINTLKKVYEQPTLLGWPSPHCTADPASSTDTP